MTYLLNFSELPRPFIVLITPRNGTVAPERLEHAVVSLGATRLLQLDLDTGQTVSEPRTNTSNTVLKLVSSMHAPGNHPLPIVGYRAEVMQRTTGCFCMVVKESTELPLLTLAVAEDREAADDLWGDLLGYCATLRSSLPVFPAGEPSFTRPETEPWYATMTMFADADELTFLRDFCRHFAWVWIDQRIWSSLRLDRQQVNRRLTIDKEHQ